MVILKPTQSPVDHGPSAAKPHAMQFSPPRSAADRLPRVPHAERGPDINQAVQHHNHVQDALSHGRQFTVPATLTPQTTPVVAGLVVVVVTGLLVVVVLTGLACVLYDPPPSVPVPERVVVVVVGFDVDVVAAVETAWLSVLVVVVVAPTVEVAPTVDVVTAPVFVTAPVVVVVVVLTLDPPLPCKALNPDTATCPVTRIGTTDVMLLPMLVMASHPFVGIFNC